MQIDLAKLTPQLKESKKLAEEKFRILIINKKAASEKEAITSKEAAICGQQEKEALALKADCEESLGRVLPILYGAQKLLEKLTSKDITTIKAYGKNCPKPIQLVMQALLMTFDIKPIVKTVNMKKQYFWWDTANKEILKTS